MGDPAESLDGNILQCSALHPYCPASYFCNIGATSDTSVCCPSFGQPCLSPLAVGTGTVSLNRFFFPFACFDKPVLLDLMDFFCHSVILVFT